MLLNEARNASPLPFGIALSCVDDAVKAQYNGVGKIGNLLSYIETLLN